MKRIFAFTLCLAMALSLSPAMAAEQAVDAELFPAIRVYEGFPDVPETAWYAPYVKICYEAGLMSGTGNGMFSPTAEMTAGEAEALAARLHYALNGGIGALPKAPAGTGTVTLLGEDGKPLALPGRRVYSSFSGLPDACIKLCYENKEAWTEDMLPTAHLLVDGVYRVDGSSSFKGDEIAFTFPITPAQFQQCDPIARFGTNGLDGIAGAWYWDSDSYLKKLDGAEGAAFSLSLEDAVARGGILSLLALVCPERVLSPKNSISVLPDTADPEVLRFYNAGIIKGIDQAGTFQGGEQLTRAEACAMLSRILRPELRLQFSIQPDGLPYTLRLLCHQRDYMLDDPTKDFRVLQYVASGWPVRTELSPILRMKSAGDNERVGLMDWNGNWILKPEFSTIEPVLADGAAAVEQDGLWGYIDADGHWILPCQYPYATQFHDGILVVGDGEKPFTTYDVTGKKLGELPVDVNYNNTAEGFIQYRDAKTGKFGCLNADGSIALKAAYDQVYPITRGLAPVGIGGKKGFVDLNGTVVVPLRYEMIASGFGDEGLAVVGCGNTEPSPLHYNGKMGMVDTKGNEVIPLIYDYLSGFYEGKAQFVRGEVRGYLLPDGSEMVVEEAQTQTPQPETEKPDLLAQWLHFTRPHNYTLVSEIRDNQAIVELGGSYFLLTLNQ